MLHRKYAYYLQDPNDMPLIFTKLIMYLNDLIEYMYSKLTSQLLHVTHPITGVQLLQLPKEVPRSPIFAFLTPEPRNLAKHCQDNGFVVRAIVPPTVPEGTQRVRVCLHAGNTFQDVDRLVASINTWLESKSGLGKDEARQLRAML